MRRSSPAFFASPQRSQRDRPRNRKCHKPHHWPKRSRRARAYRRRSSENRGSRVDGSPTSTPGGSGRRRAPKSPESPVQVHRSTPRLHGPLRSEERRVGQECVSTCTSRCAPDPVKNKTTNKQTKEARKKTKK